MCSIHDSFKTSMKQQYHNMMSYFTKSLNYYSSKSPNFPQKEEIAKIVYLLNICSEYSRKIKLKLFYKK